MSICRHPHKDILSRALCSSSHASLISKPVPQVGSDISSPAYSIPSRETPRTQQQTFEALYLCPHLRNLVFPAIFLPSRPQSAQSICADRLEIEPPAGPAGS